MFHWEAPLGYQSAEFSTSIASIGAGRPRGAFGRAEHRFLSPTAGREHCARGAGSGSDRCVNGTIRSLGFQWWKLEFHQQNWVIWAGDSWDFTSFSWFWAWNIRIKQFQNSGWKEVLTGDFHHCIEGFNHQAWGFVFAHGVSSAISWGWHRKTSPSIWVLPNGYPKTVGESSFSR